MQVFHYYTLRDKIKSELTRFYGETDTMNRQPKESDWKLYSKMVTAWRERYLEGRNSAFAADLEDSDKTPTECFWDTLKELKKESKVLTACFDPHSRSAMTQNMLLMYKHGIIMRDDLKPFSSELIELLDALG